MVDEPFKPQGILDPLPNVSSPPFDPNRPKYLILEVNGDLEQLAFLLQQDTDSQIFKQVFDGYLSEIVEYVASYLDYQSNLLEYTEELLHEYQLSPNLVEIVYTVGLSLVTELRKIGAYDIDHVAYYRYLQMADNNSIVLERIDDQYTINTPVTASLWRKT